MPVVDVVVAVDSPEIAVCVNHDVFQVVSHPACRWFSEVKKRRSEAILSYL